MNINPNLSATMTQDDIVGMTMLKKSIDIEAQGAMALINAIPQPQSSAHLPSNLGQNINTTA